MGDCGASAAAVSVARYFRPHRSFHIALAHHQRSGNHVAQALGSLAHEHGHYAHAIKAGQVVDESHQVARQRFDKVDAGARLMDHANLSHSLAQCASVAEGFKQREVAPE